MGTIKHLIDHQNSICAYVSKGGSISTKQCKVYNVITTKMCGHCSVTLCPIMKRGELKSCFADYHNLYYFGLANCDYGLRGDDKKKEKWIEPTTEQKDEWKKYIQYLLLYCNTTTTNNNNDNKQQDNNKPNGG